MPRTQIGFSHQCLFFAIQIESTMNFVRQMQSLC